MDATRSNMGGAEAAAGGNPFFRSLNQSYGEPWMSSGGVNPLNLQETPEYKDLVSREIIVGAFPSLLRFFFKLIIIHLFFLG